MDDARKHLPGARKERLKGSDEFCRIARNLRSLDPREAGAGFKVCGEHARRRDQKLPQSIFDAARTLGFAVFRHGRERGLSKQLDHPEARFPRPSIASRPPFGVMQM